MLVLLSRLCLAASASALVLRHDAPELLQELAEIRAPNAAGESMKEDGGPLRAGDTVLLRTYTGNYVTAEPSGFVHAYWDHQGEWQRFVIQREDLSEGEIPIGSVVYLVAWTGKRLSVFNKQVVANWNSTGTWERLTVEEERAGGSVLAGDTVYLRGHTRKLISAEGEVKADWEEHGTGQKLVISKVPAWTTTTPAPTAAKAARTATPSRAQPAFELSKASAAMREYFSASAARDEVFNRTVAARGRAPASYGSHLEKLLKAQNATLKALDEAMPLHDEALEVATGDVKLAEQRHAEDEANRAAGRPGADFAGEAEALKMQMQGAR